MSVILEEDFKRWTAKRKAAEVMDIIQGKTSIRSLKERCTHRQQFETLQHASRVISDWIHCYNQRRLHQTLAMKTPA